MTFADDRLYSVSKTITNNLTKQREKICLRLWDAPSD